MAVFCACMCLCVCGGVSAFPGGFVVCAAVDSSGW